MDKDLILERIREDHSHHLMARFLALGLFAVAMAYMESAVVIYLRMLYYPEGFEIVLKPMPLNIYLLELGREAATMVMLFVVARLSFRSFWLRFSAFLYLFAVWDIFYYVWLFVFIRWPLTLTTWDILFLIPVAWIGPVWSPLFVSLNFIAASFILNGLLKKGVVLRARWYHWVVTIAGAGMIFYSYVNRVPELLKGVSPTVYSWKWLLAGLAIGWLSLGIALLQRSWIRVNGHSSKDRNKAVSQRP